MLRLQGLAVVGKPKPRFLLGLFFMLVMIGVGRAADAQSVVTFSVTGTLETNQTDTLGLFGPINGDLSNKPFSTTISYNPSNFSTLYPNYYVSAAAGAITISITINGVTVSQTSAAYTISPPYSGDVNLFESNEPNYSALGSGPNFPTLDIDYFTTGTPSLLVPAAPSLGNIVSLTSENSVNSETLSGLAGSLNVINPFAITDDVSDITLNGILPDLNLADEAMGLEADGAAAVIVALQTDGSGKSVTFTTDNGTTLQPFTSNFFQASPAKGETSLNVTPILVGSAYFAVAMLQAPLPGSSFSYEQPIHISSKYSGHEQTANIELVPPPVLLVHGIWSDSSALQKYATALKHTKPWAKKPSPIYSMDYPSANAFYDQGSLSQMDISAASLINRLLLSEVAGSRIDVVAHSMGGLLARAYSGTASYAQPNNRQQGVFHTIVTLDTPEAGSALATYLLDHKDSTITKEARKTPLEVAWLAFCKSANINIKVAQCFKNEKTPINDGAVDSLDPNNPTLLQTPPPNIPGANWRAVSASNTSGYENAGLTALIQSIDTNYFTNPAPITTILGSPNDDIVSLDSQLAGQPTSFVTFSGLAHSAAFGDMSVTNAPEAIDQALCWLNDTLGVACGASAVPAAMAADNPPPRYVSGRLSITHRNPFGMVGKPLTLGIHAPGLSSLRIVQTGNGGDTASEDFKIPEVGENSSVTIVPKMIGIDDLTIFASFSDGSVEVASLKISNRLDPGIVLSIKGFELSPMIMRHAGMRFQLTPTAEVRGLDDPVRIDAISQYEVETPSANPPISVDDKGMVTALHSGRGVVKVSCEGHSDEVVVEVK